MSPFSPAPCPLRSHRPQLSGREHSAPTLLNQRFSGIWCHSTPPPPSCQGEKSSSLALAARWGGTGRPCLQERRAAPQGPGGAQAAGRRSDPAPRPPRKGGEADLRVSSPSLSPAAPIAPDRARRGKEGKSSHPPLTAPAPGRSCPERPQGPTRAGLQLGGAGKVFSPKRLSEVETAGRSGQRGDDSLGRPGTSAAHCFFCAGLPHAPPQCGRGTTCKRRCGEGFSSALLDLRGVRNCLLLVRECSPHRTHSKGGA